MSYIIHATFINSVGKTINFCGKSPLSLECADAWLEYLKKNYPDLHHWKEAQ